MELRKRIPLILEGIFNSTRPSKPTAVALPPPERVEALPTFPSHFLPNSIRAIACPGSEAPTQPTR